MCSLPQKSIHALCLTSVSLQKGATSSYGGQHENRENYLLGHFTIPKGLACPCTGRDKFSSAFISGEHRSFEDTTDSCLPSATGKGTGVSFMARVSFAERRS